MAKPAPVAEVVLAILLDRIQGLPNEDIARRHGYKAKGLDDLLQRYKLADIEREIRLHILGQGAELSPEAIEINRESDERLAKYGNLIDREVTELQKSDDENPEAELTMKDRLARVSFLETAARGVEGIRSSRIKAVGITADAKKKQKAENKPEEEGYKSAYADLANEDDDDGTDEAE